MKSQFLPLGLLGAILAGLSFPDSGISLSQWRGLIFSPIQWLVALVFLVFGLVFELKRLPRLGLVSKALAIAVGVNLFGGPLLAQILSASFSQASWFTSGLSIGLVIMLTVPTTVSSGIVLAKQSGGSIELSVVITLALTLLGVITMSYFLSAGSWSQSWDRLLAIGSNVLLPLALGAVIKRFYSAPRNIALLPSAAIITVVWMAVSVHQQAILSLSFQTIVLFSLLALASHILLFTSAWFLGKLASLDRASIITLAMVASQKTLPLALLSLSAFPPAGFSGKTAAQAVAFCVIFHFSQIVFDSLISIRLNALNNGTFSAK